LINKRVREESEGSILRIQDALSRAIDVLKKDQIETARLDAEILLAHVFNCERYQLYLRFDEDITLNQYNEFMDLIEKRLSRWPVAYLINKKEFMSMEFYVTPEVLIPRPDTELLVEKSMEIIKKIDREALVVDVGTGSGAIAVSLAHFMNNVQVIATDISEGALKIAKKNAKRHGVIENITFLQEGLLNSILQNFFCVDIIIANLPYIPTGEIKLLSEEVQKEPITALDGGIDGLEYYNKLLGQAYLALEKGYLLLEIGHGQAKKIFDLAGGGWKKKLYYDLAGRERVIVLERVCAG